MSYQSIQQRHQQNGYSLIEVMIAVALSIGLLTGIIQILSNSRKNQSWNEAQNQIEDVGQFALDQLSDTFRYRGFEGCAKPSSFQNQASATSVLITNFLLGNSNAPLDNQALRGYQINAANEWLPAPTFSYLTNLKQGLKDTTGNTVIPRTNSDLVSIYHAEQHVGLLTADMTSASDVITISDPNNPPAVDFAEGDWATLSDCNNAVLFAVTANNNNQLSHNTPANISDNLSQTFRQNAEIRQALVDVFFVADTHERPDGQPPLYGLYRYRNGKAPELLIEGIEFLKIQYGEVTSSTGDTRYVDANHVTDWPQVKSVRIGLIATSTTTILPANDTSDYVIAGSTITADDYTSSGARYLRKPLNLTVQLRNAL